MKRSMRLALLLLLAGALVIGVYILSQPHEAAWRVPQQHQRFVQNALAGAANAFGTTEEEYRRAARPRVQERGHETCVTFATRWSHVGGSYIACFDTETGAINSERAVGMPFGGTRLTDWVAQWVW
jgi:hypothetical protein